jgi:predicted Ser/Thr protein kinase
MDTEALNRGDILRNRYRIDAVIGQGAYGMVYQASDLTIPGSLWAIKEIWEGSLSDDEREEALELFAKEAQILKELNHTGIPKVLDSFSEGPRHYMVMEFIEGETIETLAGKGKPDVKTVLSWASRVCDILEYLHTLNPPVIFRDLKPSNIMITKRGRVMLIDFGIARFFNPMKKQDTAIMGTPGFSPPEQYGTGQSDERSDIYSLGATLYHILSGEDLEQFSFIVPALSRYNRHVSPDLDSIIARCLQKEPGNRYQRVSELKKDIAALMEKKGFAPAPAMQPPAPAAQAQTPAQGSPSYSYTPILVAGGAWFLLFLLMASRSRFFYDNILLFLMGTLVASLVAGIYYLVARSCSMVLLTVFTVVMAAMVIPNFYRPPHYGGQLTACKSNLKNIGTAMEMYSSDNQGRYPPSIDRITPNYLKTLPTCPSAGKVTYRYIYTTKPDCYTAWCSGSYHTPTTGPNYPQYDAIQGLYEGYNR